MIDACGKWHRSVVFRFRFFRKTEYPLYSYFQML